MSVVKTTFTDLTGIDYPILQAPMIGGYSTPEMVAAVSNHGALGSLALGNSSPEAISDECIKTFQLTDKPFAANFFVTQHISMPSVDESIKAIDALTPYYEELGLVPMLPKQIEHASTQNIHDQIDAVINMKVPIVTFTFGIPSVDIIKKLKSYGVTVIATATSLPECQMIEKAGFDAVILQGISAGGHRASFLTDGKYGPDTALLYQQTRSLISIPKIVAGGIRNGSQIADYLRQGVSACQLGTPYLLTNEANVNEFYLSSIQSATKKTCLSNAYTGKYGRLLCNRFTSEMANKSFLIFPLQGRLTAGISNKAATNRKYDLLPLWLGESPAVDKKQTTESLTKKLINELNVAMCN